MMKNKQPTAVSIRATMQQQHMASARNRRLAQQMENRPSVQAALQHKQVGDPASEPAKRDMPPYTRENIIYFSPGLIKRQV